MAHRCNTCNGLIGPEDAVGDVTQPALCRTCRERAEAREARKAASNHPSAVAGRRAKALAMAAVIDANFIRQYPELDPYDQAARIRLVSFTWSDETWESIGENAVRPNGKHYERKVISDETKRLVREVYEGRANAPLQQVAS